MIHRYCRDSLGFYIFLRFIVSQNTGKKKREREREISSSPRSGIELVGSSWWPLLSLEVLALGGGGGGGGLMLEVELTTTVAGGGGGGPLFLPWLPRIWDCGDISTVSPRACPWGGRGHQPCNTLMALRTSACSSAALSRAVWATFVTGNPRYRGLHKDHVTDNTSL